MMSKRTLCLAIDVDMTVTKNKGETDERAKMKII